MTIDVYSMTGDKQGTMSLPETLFAAPIHHGLMHQAVLLQRGNAKTPVAHVKTRSEVRGSTKKLYMQKHTGRARRGSVRSPVLRGGGKAFGPRNLRNEEREMPKAMRHAALRSCLSLQAKKGSIMGLDSFGDVIKTKTAHDMLLKMPVDLGRSILIVVPETHSVLSRSIRNIPGVKAISAAYLNPIDVLGARHLIFMKGSVERAEEVFGKKARVREVVEADETTEKPVKKSSSAKATADEPVAKKAAPKKATKKTA